MRTARRLLASLLFLSASLTVAQDHTTGNFHGCPPEGKAKTKRGFFDPVLDSRKNRDLPPPSYEGKTVTDFLDNVPAQAAAEGKKARSKWAQKSLDEIAPWEAKGATVEGYILKVLPEKGEACNCGSLTYHDFHMFLAKAKSDTREQSMVVEISPRLLPSNTSWTPTALMALGMHKAKVRISGWITWDQEHPEQLVPAANRGPTRGTLWEIHPIHKIEVWTNSAWTEF